MSDLNMNAPTDPNRKLLSRFRGEARDGAAVVRMNLTTPMFIQAGKQKLEKMTLRVYRRETPGFVFGEDYDEYFQGMQPVGADLVFEGVLPLNNGRVMEYRDSSARMGSTYAYWAATDRGDAPVGPVALKIRDPEVWWPYAAVCARLKSLAATHPDLVSCRTYGHSVKGRELLGVAVGRGEPTLALVGTLHAGESGPELIVPALERLAAEHGDLLRRVRVVALPSVNVDERDRLASGTPWYLRTNANHVDLNRNFEADWETVDGMYGVSTDDPRSVTYRGPRVASEPETVALVRFVEEAKARALFSYHCLASITGVGAVTAKAALSDPAYWRRCETYAGAYTRGFLGTPDAKFVLAPHGAVACSGSLPLWAFRKQGLPCVDLEGGGRPGEDAACKDHTTREILTEYQHRHYNGILATLKFIAEESAK